MVFKSMNDFRSKLRIGTKLTMVYHWREELKGKRRRITKIQRNCFYSVIDGEPDSEWSKCNDGLGLRTDYKIAKCWEFRPDGLIIYNADAEKFRGPVMMFKVED